MTDTNQTSGEPKAKARAGWYPDPKAEGSQRYWTGTEWTEQRAPLPSTAVPGRRQPVLIRIWALLLAVAAIAIWFGMAPNKSYAHLRSNIEQTNDANNASTEGAPQQEVVNGWTTIEYLRLLSIQQEESDNRRDALFLLAVVGGTVGAASWRGSSVRR